MVDALADRAPSGPNGMTVYRAGLTFDAPILRALADGPFRARLEDTRSSSGIKAIVGVRVLVSEADVVRGHVRNAKRQL